MADMRTVVQAPWTAEEVARLHELRGQGLGSTTIARMIGRTEASVTTKIRALRLPLSPKPARVIAKANKPPPVPRVGKISLPPLPSLADE